MKRNISVILFLLILSSFVFWVVQSRRPAQHDNAGGKIQVVASFYPLYFFASSIGGDRAQVSNITPPGAEPHDYEMTSGDLMKMEKSQLIILNGAGLESWQDNLQKNIESQKTKIVVAGEGLTTQQVSEDGQTGIDPHVWLAPLLAQKMVDKIAQGFSEVDPLNENYYNKNAGILKNQLAELDAQYRASLNDCGKRDIITSHSAFGYLATAYGLRQISIAGLSPDAEPSSSQLADIAKFAQDNSVKYIFFENLASPKLAETIAKEVGAQTLVLDPLEGLSQEDTAQGQNYITVMQTNLTNLETALECHK